MENLNHIEKLNEENQTALQIPYYLRVCNKKLKPSKLRLTEKFTLSSM